MAFLSSVLSNLLIALLVPGGRRGPLLGSANGSRLRTAGTLQEFVGCLHSHGISPCDTVSAGPCDAHTP